jgi:hypothetical protein
MQDMQTRLEKLHRDAVDCALISKRGPMLRRKSCSTGSPITYTSYCFWHASQKTDGRHGTVQSSKIDVAAIHDIDGSGLWRDQIQR